MILLGIAPPAPWRPFIIELNCSVTAVADLGRWPG